MWRADIGAQFLRFAAPLPCLALASGFALAINFAGAHLVVFRRSPT